MVSQTSSPNWERLGFDAEISVMSFHRVLINIYHTPVLVLEQGTGNGSYEKKIGVNIRKK